MADYETVQLDIQDDGLAAFKFDRPEKKNALSPQLFREFIDALDEIHDSDARITTITGRGDAFCSGMDLEKYFAESRTGDPKQMGRVREYGTEAYTKLERLRTPTIAVINGWALGGGYTVQSLCDLAFADRDAQLGLTEINWGTAPGGAAAWSILNTVDQREASYRALTGELMTGEEAEALGAVTRSVPEEELEDTVQDLVGVLLEKDQLALEFTKKVLRRIRWMTFEEARDYGTGKTEEMRAYQGEGGAHEGIERFLSDEYRPGERSYRQSEDN